MLGDPRPEVGVSVQARPDGGADKRYGRTKDGKPTKSLNRFDPDRKGGKPEYGRPDPGPRVQVSRTRDEEGEWIRAEQPARRKDDEGFGGRRSFGEVWHRHLRWATCRRQFAPLLFGLELITSAPVAVLAEASTYGTYRLHD